MLCKTKHIFLLLLCSVLISCVSVEKQEDNVDLACIEKVNNFKNIINKTDITKVDIDYISSIYNDAYYSHYSVRSFNGGIPHSVIDYCGNNTDVFSESEMNILKGKITQYCKINYWDKLKKLEDTLCDKYDNLKIGCLVDFNDYYVTDFGVRKDGVIVAGGYLFGTVFGKESFIYDTREHYDNQQFDTNDYLYSYVGIYKKTVQKMPAFKRTNQKISTYFKETDANEWCKHVKNTGD